MVPTLLASATRPLWRLLERHDLDAERVFREAGLDPDLQGATPRRRISVGRYRTAWRRAAELLDDPCLGLSVAEAWKSTDLHAFGCAFLASTTLRTALGRLARYAQVVNDGIAFDLDDDGENVSVIYAATDPRFPLLFKIDEDIIWALVVSLCRSSFGEDLKPIDVRLRHAAPICKQAYDAFFRCPVSFASELSQARFACSDLDQPLSTAHRELALASDGILTEFLGKLCDDDLVNRVKAVIAEQLPSGSPTDETVAKALFMSRRTLQRKLAEKGTSYFELLEAVRRKLAQQYIGDPALSFQEISFLIGFSGHPAFSRAFKRWTGLTPREARAAAAA